GHSLLPIEVWPHVQATAGDVVVTTMYKLTVAGVMLCVAHSSGTDHLEVDYRSPDHGHFTIAIPDDWTDRDLLELIFLPPREPGKRNWPAWEIPAYDFVSSRLFRFWKGEKKPDK